MWASSPTFFATNLDFCRVYYIVMERKEALHGRRTDCDPLLGAKRAGHFGNPGQIRPLPAKNRQQYSQ